MKNFFKLLGIIALVAVIGFSMAACGGDDDSGGSSGTPSFDGIWKGESITITISGDNISIDTGMGPVSYTLGMVMKANGSENGVGYIIWSRSFTDSMSSVGIRESDKTTLEYYDGHSTVTLKNKGRQ